MQITYYCRTKSTGQVIKSTTTLGKKTPEQVIAFWNKVYGENHEYSLAPFEEKTFGVPQFYYRVHRMTNEVTKRWFEAATFGQPSTIQEAIDRCAMWTYASSAYKYTIEPPDSKYATNLGEVPFLLSGAEAPKQLSDSADGLKLWHMRASERYIKYNFVTFAATKAEAQSKIIAKINSEYGHNFAMHLSEKEVYEVGDETVAIIEGKGD